MLLVERIGRLGRAALSDRVLRERMVREIRRSVPFDGHIFAMTDPVSGVVSSPHATLPMVPLEQLPRLVGKRYACPDLDEWSDWLAVEFHVGGVTRTELRDRHGIWGFLELWRTDACFTDVEKSCLSQAQPMLTAAIRAAVGRSFGVAYDDGDSTTDAQRLKVEPGVILLDTDLQVHSETDAAARALLRLLPNDAETTPVPAVAFNVGAALLAAWTTPWTRIFLGGRNSWMTARADRMADRIAVSISPCTPLERVDLFARSHALSPREVEVLHLVLRGLDSRHIAASLTIAPTTAEDHLRSLLAKTNTTSRTQLLLRALGGNQP